MKKYIFILFAIIVASHIYWFHPIGTLTHGDAGILGKLYLESVYNFPIKYGVYEGGAHMRADIMYFPILYLFSLLGQIGIHYDIASRIILFLPALLLAPFGIFFILKKYTSLFGAFLGALFFLFNTYILQLQLGHILILLSGGLSIWGLYFGVIRQNFYFSFFLYLLSCMVDIRIAYIFLLIHMVYSIGFMDTNKKKLLSLSIPLYPIVISTFLILIATSGTNVLGAIIERDIFGDWLFDFMHAFTISHPMWTGSKPIFEFIQQGLSPYALLVPFIVIIFLIFNVNKKYYTFIILFLFGVFLTKQNATPFENSYTWLYNNIPLFSTYRESSKFFWISIMGVTPILALSYDYLYKKSIVFSRIFASIWIGTLFYTALPLFTLSVEGIFIPRYSYQAANNFNNILSQDDTTWNFIQFPASSRWIDSNIYHKNLVITPIEEYFICGRGINCESSLYEKLKEKNVRYVIVPKDYPEGADYMFDFNKNIYGDRQLINRYLEKVFTKSSLSSPGFTIYIFKNEIN